MLDEYGDREINLSVMYMSTTDDKVSRPDLFSFLFSIIFFFLSSSDFHFIVLHWCATAKIRLAGHL